MVRAESPAPREGAAVEPCIGLLETCSVARGLEVANAVLWRSAVAMLFCEPVSGGAFVQLFTGAVDEVRSSLARGAEVAGEDLKEEILIANLEPSILDALRGRFASISLDAVGILETSTVGATVLAADAAAKTAAVVPLEMRLGNQLGGKAFVVFGGGVGDVRAAIGAGAEVALTRHALLREIVIAGPHPDLGRLLKAPRA